MKDSERDILMRLPHLQEDQWREHGETIRRYESAGRFGKWLIRRRHPRAYRHYQYLQAQKSITDARIAAAANPFNDELLGAA